MKKIYFYHTNDLHSHFENWPRIVGYLKRQKAKHKAANEPYFCIDVGDHADRFHSLTEGTMGAANVELLNRAGYDLVTIGNNEGVTFTKAALDNIYKEREFQVVLANLFDENGKRPEWCEPFQIIETDGVRIGFTAATAPFTPFYSRLGWDIKDPFDVLPQIIGKLRNETDIVVLLSHMGLPFDERAAREIDGIDVILGAHTHQLLEEGEWRNQTLITQTGKFGTHVGKLEIQFDKEMKKIHELKETAISLDGEPDRETEEQLQRLHKRSGVYLSEEITVLDHEMPSGDFERNELGIILADALKHWCDGDIGMANAGLIVDGLSEGSVTRGDLHRVCPHPINPCKVSLSGEEVLGMMEKGLEADFQQFELKGFGFRGKRIGKLIFSGLTFDYREDNQVHNVKINGQAIQLKQIYQVAVPDMFTFGRLLTQISQADHKDYYLPEMMRDLLAWKLKKEEYQNS